MSLQEGSIVEFYRDRKIAAAFCSELKNGIPIFIMQDGQELKLSESKILFSSLNRSLCGASNERIKEFLSEHIARCEEISHEIPLAELWEFAIADRGEEQEYSLEELSQLYFGTSVTDDEISGMLRAVAANKIYFLRKENRIIVNSQEKCTTLLKQAELAEENRKRKEQEQLERAQRILKYKSLIKDFLSGIDNRREEWNPLIALLKDAAIYGKESPSFKEVTEFISDIDRTPFQLLVELGIFEPNTNLSLYKYNIEQNFSKELLDEAEYLSHISLDGAEYVDHTSLFTVTIDDEASKDLDDALSFEMQGENYSIGVHIADITAYIEKYSSLDQNAHERGSSIYTPDRNINMLPETLSESSAALTIGDRRAALSFFFLVSPDAEVLDFHIESSFVNIDQRLTYDEVELLEDPTSPIAIMSQLAHKFQQKRIAAGALHLPIQHVAVKVIDGVPFLKRDNPSSPMQILVSEFMILANSYTAEFLNRHEIPVIYRNQSKPEEKLPELKDPENPIELFKLRKFLTKVYSDTESVGHFGIGVDFYTQVTSPLRRYSDLVMHRQLKHFLKCGEPLYSKEELGMIIAEMNHLNENIGKVERESRMYWLSKYMDLSEENLFKAIVLRNSYGRVHIRLLESLTEFYLDRSASKPLFPGNFIYVKKKKGTEWGEPIELTFSHVAED